MENKLLNELYKKYKGRNKKFDKYTTSEYFNYLDEILKSNHILTKDIIKQFKQGNNIHYISDTIIGKNIYNAKVLEVNENYIIIKPSNWKNKGLKFSIGENVYLHRGYI